MTIKLINFTVLLAHTEKEKQKQSKENYITTVGERLKVRETE